MMHTRSNYLYTVYVGNSKLTVTGRKITRLGYATLRILDHPNKGSDGYIFEHRIMMEQEIGRFLNKNEVVHHLNEVKHDNRIENLELMTKGKHTKLHHVGASRSGKTKLLMSQHMKNRLKEKSNHPSYKDVDTELLALLKKGVTKSEAARRLNITRKTIYNKIKYLKWEI